HRLVHPAPVEVGACGTHEVVDELVHLLVRRRPVEPALPVLDIAVERGDRGVDQSGHESGILPLSGTGAAKKSSLVGAFHNVQRGHVHSCVPLTSLLSPFPTTPSPKSSRSSRGRGVSPCAWS